MELAFDVYEPPEDADKSLSPVVLLHGRLDSRKTWKDLAPTIAKETGRKVYAYDARNHGESPWSDEMDFEILLNDLAKFISDRDIQRAVLVGHSMGGRTAITFALHEPEKVEKLFVEDMVVESYSPKSTNVVMQIIALMRRSLTAIPPEADETEAKRAAFEFMKFFLPPGSSNGFLYDADTMPLKKVEEGYTWQANLDVLEDMLKNRSVQTFSGVYDGEAMFLYGNRSFFDVENDESISKYFPRALKVCVEGAGHLIHQDYPQEFLRGLLKFI